MVGPKKVLKQAAATAPATMVQTGASAATSAASTSISRPRAMSVNSRMFRRS